MAALNEVEVLVLGGYDSNQLVGDAVIFDTETEQCHKVAVDASFEFYAFGNQCMVAQSNQMIALVKNNRDIPQIVRYTRGESSVEVVHELPKW